MSRYLGASRLGHSLVEHRQWKQNAMRISISYSGNTFSKEYAAGATVTVSSVITDRNLKAAMGFGDNVQAQLGGTSVANDVILRDGDHIVVVTKANEKA